jgi:glycosyltransferase involved in cell wall biosynthesis
MRIAWFTPFALKSAIGDYSEAIVTVLSKYDDVTLFVPQSSDHGPIRDTDLPCERVPIDATEEFLAKLTSYDLLVYNMGNNLPFHLPIYQTAIRCPGIVILHDVVMRDFFHGYFYQENYELKGYPAYLLHAHGSEAEQFGSDVISGKIAETIDEPQRLMYPLFQPILHGALGVVVHSKYARQRVVAEVATLTRTIDFPSFGPSRTISGFKTSQADAPDGKVRILSFGVLNSNKLIHETISAIAGSEILRQYCLYDVIGRGTQDYEESLKQLIHQHRLESTVRLLGWQSDERLQAALLGSDIVVNLRNPHLGESSAVLVTSLLAGVATIVWDHGYYGEFPEDVVIKIHSETEIGKALERLVTEKETRIAYAENARNHALHRFNTESYCVNLKEFATEVLYQKPQLALADTISKLLLELGSSEEFDELSGQFAGLIAGMSPVAVSLPHSQRVEELPV